MAEVALLDRDGVIVTVNDAWESFCRDNGGDAGRTGVGMSYLDVCASAGDDDGVQEAVALVRDALAGQVMAPVSLLIPCDAPGRPRLFDMLVSSRFDDDGRCVGAAVVMVPHPLEATGTGPGPIPAQRLTFPDLPRLELERTLAQLASQSQHALAAQGRLRALLQANAEVVSALDLPIVLRKFVAAARDLVHARTAVLSVQGPEGAPDQLVHAGTREPPVVRTGGPSPGPGALTVPVRVRGRLFGHLHLTTAAPGGFSSEDESLAASLAGTAAVAIENATLFEDSERRRRWQEAGAAAGRQLFDGDRDRALVAVLQLAEPAADGDFAMLVSTDDLGRPRVTAFLGAITAEEYAATPGLGAKVFDPVLQDGVPVLVEHDQPGPGAGPRFGSTITVPFHDDDRVLAGLTVGRLSSHRPFQPADLDQFVAFTAQAEVVVRLDRARAGAGDDEHAARARPDRRGPARPRDHRAVRDRHGHAGHAGVPGPGGP